MPAYMKKLWPLLYSALFIFALAGCGGSSSTGEGSNLPNPNLKFINASPDGGSLTLSLNGEVLFPNVPYLGATPGFTSFKYISEADGGYDAILIPTDGGEEIDRDYKIFDRGSNQLAIALGLRFPGDDLFKRLRVSYGSVDRTRPVGGKSRLLVLHALSEPPGTDTPAITFTNPGKNPLVSVDNIDFGMSKKADVDAGTFTFQAKRADVTGDTIYVEQQLTFAPGAIYLVVISGIVGASDPAQQPKITLVPIEPK